MSRSLVIAIVLHVILVAPCLGQHAHDKSATKSLPAPKIFLDKSPKIVEYQLKRLTNEQLLLVERAVTDRKYLPVYQALLMREGIPRALRDEALAGLVALNQTDSVRELTAVLGGISGTDASATRMIRSLATMLLEISPAELAKDGQQLSQLASHADLQLSAVGYAGWILAGQATDAWEHAGTDRQKLQRLLTGIVLIPVAAIREQQQAHVFEVLPPRDGASVHEKDVHQAALRALATMSTQAELTFEQAALLIQDSDLQAAAVKTLLSVPAAARDATRSGQLIEWLVNFAEQTPAAERTSEAFLDAMELVEQLLASAPSELSKSYRQRLRETVVRVIRMHTVEEEMRYDIPYFAVEAGRPVQVVLVNDDMMPHNLVFTLPGALQEVAEAGLVVGPTGGWEGKQYVPQSDKVLVATDMVAAREQAVLTFTAPARPGEYPYVCTFPRHWMRMYGVMVVVDDLDAWLKNPVAPKDPIGSNRHFVQNWNVSHFAADLPAGLRGRTHRIGEKLFEEATCGQCHKLGAVGVGQVGPELKAVFERWKGEPIEVLREILDPSHRIDEKYAVHIILTTAGQTFSGLIVEETKEAVSILENPESKQPRVLAKEEIEEMQKTANSMMPKGLLDQYSKDEILEILAYIQSLQQP
jgi:putative heme-binding domain-containing protein